MGYNIKQNDDGSTSLVNEADSAEVMKLDIDGNVSFTAATAVDLGTTANKYEAVTAANTITANETGTHYVLNSATGFASTLPTPALGLEFWFHIGPTEPSSGNHTVVTASSANIMEGNICSPEDAAGSVSVAADSDTITFVASTAVHGDFAHVWCDGTNWYVDGMCSVQDAMTLTQAT